MASINRPGIPSTRIDVTLHWWGQLFFVGLLLASLLSFAIRDYTSNLIGAMLPDLFALMLLVIVLARSDAPTFTRSDLPMIVFFSYFILHPLIILVSNPETGFEILNPYRLIYRGIPMYMFLRQQLNLPRPPLGGYVRAVHLVGGVIFADVIIESFLFNFLGFDLRSLPWADVEFRGTDSIINYGNPDLNTIRVPTVLGMPHRAAVVALALLFASFHLNGRVGKPTPVWFVVMGVITVILADSKVNVAILIATLFLYVTHGWPGSRRLFGSVVLGAFVLLTFSLRDSLPGYFDNVWAGVVDGVVTENVARSFEVGQGGLDLVPYENLQLIDPKNVGAYLFGLGGVDSSVYGPLYKVYDLEIGFFLELLPRYGLLFVVIYLWVALSKIHYAHDKVRFSILLALAPFYLGAVHFWLNFRLGVFEVFILCVALLASAGSSRSDQMADEWQDGPESSVAEPPTVGRFGTAG